jgi:hypothetical protein
MSNKKALFWHDKPDKPLGKHGRFGWHSHTNFTLTGVSIHCKIHSRSYSDMHPQRKKPN